MHDPLFAGMPSPVRLTEAATMRLETLSFFLMAFLASALVIRWIWNALRLRLPAPAAAELPQGAGPRRAVGPALIGVDG